jgi:hypothetical protein
MTDDHRDGAGPPVAEEIAPLPAWLITDDLTEDQELELRKARLRGLDLRNQNEDAA